MGDYDDFVMMSPGGTALALFDAGVRAET